jgi:protein-S-isoprenylcysteine O-methyltransferase Ste14
MRAGSAAEWHQCKHRHAEGKKLAMESDQLFRVIFFVLFIVLLAIRAYFGWKVRQKGQSSWSVNREVAKREGKCSILLRPLMFLAVLLLTALYAVLPGGPAWLVLPLPAGVRALGAALGVFGLLFLIRVHSALREYWSTVLQLRKEHSLINTGPYRRIRHPMYSALMTCFLSLALVSAAWPLLLLAVLTVPFFYRVTVKEEAMMTEQFGEEYHAYRGRTGRFLPQVFPARGQN